MKKISLFKGFFTAIFAVIKLSPFIPPLILLPSFSFLDWRKYLYFWVDFYFTKIKRPFSKKI